MLSKNEVKYIQSLYHKKKRDESGLFIAEGARIVNELLLSDYQIHKIYAVEKWIQQHANVKNVQKVSWSEMEKITSLQTPGTVLAIAFQKNQANLAPSENRITLVLDGIQDPGNFGTIVRIADWFGIEQIIAGDDTVELYNPKVIQSTMGSFVRVNVQYSYLNDFLQENKLPVYGAVLNGESIYTTGKINQGLIIIGNEGKGISEDILPFIQYKITIPRIGKTESLNAAVATGIILSHVTM